MCVRCLDNPKNGRAKWENWKSATNRLDTSEHNSQPNSSRDPDSKYNCWAHSKRRWHNPSHRSARIYGECERFVDNLDSTRWYGLASDSTVERAEKETTTSNARPLMRRFAIDCTIMYARSLATRVDRTKRPHLHHFHVQPLHYIRPMKLSYKFPPVFVMRSRKEKGECTFVY